MKICVAGLWHLGTVTAACLAAAGHDVVGLDFDPSVVAALGDGRPPILEPGLDELLKSGLAAGRLRFTSDPAAATKDADVVWITYDTPVDDDDRADVESVVERTSRLFPHLEGSTIALISSQVPVGTTARIERLCASAAKSGVHFAYSPENLLLGSAIEAFTRADRTVVGVRHETDRKILGRLIQPFTDRIEWMTVESAEMTKHAINAFLATSITFINEIAALCERTGADAIEVARGLKSEPRIGPRAYLSPGGAIAGGTLARDVQFLEHLGLEHAVETPVLSAVPASNRQHRDWVERRLVQALGDLSGKTVAVWGLTYKPGTSTLRRSSAVELCRWLIQTGAVVRAHDPAINRPGQLPDDLVNRLTLTSDALAAADGAAALVVATPWPEYEAVKADALASRMRGRAVLDPGGFLADSLSGASPLEYITFGKGMRPAAAARPARSPGKAFAPDRALAGRNAVITGASQGLGLAIARAYVEAGANVMLCARDATLLEKARADVAARARSGQVVLARVADVTSANDVKDLAAGAIKAFARVHVLVNNAGVYGPFGPVEDVDWDEWVRAVSINLLGSVLACRAFVPHFKQAGSAKIVQVSGGGATNPMARVTAYAASKAAVVRFAESLAEELRADRIEVNALAPGALNTQMLDQILAAGPEKVGSALYQRMLKQKAEGGIAPETGAALAVWLGSAASDGITGKLLSAVWDPWETLSDHVDDLKGDVYTLRRIIPADRKMSWGDRR